MKIGLSRWLADRRRPAHAYDSVLCSNLLPCTVLLIDAGDDYYAGACQTSDDEVENLYQGRVIMAVFSSRKLKFGAIVARSFLFGK